MNDNEFWFSMAGMLGLFFLLWMLLNFVNQYIKQYHKNKQYWGKSPDSIPPMFEKMTDKVMEERDAELDDLKERVATLERLVTEHHHISESQKLANEIDNLQEK